MMNVLNLGVLWGARSLKIRNEIISALIKKDVAHVQLVTDLQHEPFAAAGDADCSIRHCPDLKNPFRDRRSSG